MFTVIRHAGLSSGKYPKTVFYRKWISMYEDKSPEKMRELKQAAESFTSQPLISVIMPVYNATPRWLNEAIGSVLSQIYTNWELCIADDASDSRQCLQTLKHFEKADARIRVIYRRENGHISNASNSALELARGEWIALMDQDDVLSVDALVRVAGLINRHPEARLVYSDEDKLDENGGRFDPYFKCDWNYQLFLSQNMISHLGVYHRETIRKIGGFRPGFEGSQDYDLALRFIGQIQPEQIFHIPRVLYHWRVHNRSTAVGAEAKPYAVIAGQKAISEHLERQQVYAKVEILPIHMYRVKYLLPEVLPKISVIIPTRNNKDLLQTCLESVIEKTDYPDFEILVINNASDDPATIRYLNKIREHPEVRVLNDVRPFNFSALNNRAVESARSELICFLNDDTEVINADWLCEMVSMVMQPGIAIVGARLWYPDGRLQHGGVILGIGGVGSHAHKGVAHHDYGYFCRAVLQQEFSAVTAACMLIRKDVFVQAGGFDEENLRIAYNDVDLCLKVKSLGYKVAWTPFAELYHHESVSRGDDFAEDQIRRFKAENEFMFRKWPRVIQNDPAYSSNLTIKAENFDLAFPPRIVEDLSVVFSYPEKYGSKQH